MASMDFPSFFKVIVHDSKAILRIPTLFVKTYEQILPKHVLLKTKSGETWSVKIEQIDVHYCFTDGWPKFMNDHELEMGDLLVFWLITGENSIFKVAIYGIDACEKELNSATTSHCPIKVEPEAIHELDLKTTYGGKRRKSKKIENRSHGAQISFNSVEDRCFTKVMAKHHQSRLHIPLLFAKKTGLIGKTKVMLQYLNGWDTTVELKQTVKPHTLDMCRGWPEFRKKNRLFFGKKYVFEYIPETGSIQVQLHQEQS